MGLQRLPDIDTSGWARKRRLAQKACAEAISRIRLFVEKIDSDSNIYIGIDIPVEELKARIKALPRLNFVHLDHKTISQTPNETIITLARKDPAIKEKLVVLANAGFHLYVLRDGVSSMVRHRRIKTLWRNVIAGDIKVDSNDIFYKLEPATGAGEPRLLVVFSAIAAQIYTPSLMRHFEQNFATAAKYVPKNTNILRIADFGGVVGSFYLNSHALPRHEDHIHARIVAMAKSLGVADENIVLYGTSKGGTAAAFYAMRHGWRAVAVDPILSDEHYVKSHRDLHFTLGTSASTKQERFAEVIQNVHAQTRLSVVCSTRSPQFPFIESTLVDRFRDRFLFLNSENTDIKTHPDVGRQTLPHALAQINRHLAGLEAPGGFHTVW